MNFKGLTIFLISCFLVAGCNRLSQSNFEKIKPNMSTQAVIAILGEPTASESLNIGGMSGTAATWKNETAEIDIQFLNDKVVVKSYSLLESEKDKK